MRVLYLVTNFPRWDGDVHCPWLVELIHRLEARGVAPTVCAPAHRGLGDHVHEGIPVRRFRYAPAAWETLTHESGAPNKLRAQPLYAALLPGYLIAGRLAVGRLCRPVIPRERSDRGISMSERTEADIEIPRAAAGPRNDSPAGAPFDVIHVHWPMPQGLLLPRRLPAGARVVTTFYGADVALARKIPALRGPLRAVVERSDAVAAISRHTAAAVAELTGVEPAVIPYGVDMAPRGDPADARQGERAGVEVLTVGRLIERKGHLVLLEAMARLRERRRDVALTIVGEGHERPRIEARVRELGLSDCVRLAGRVSDAELRAAYAGCDMFVLPAIVDSAGDTEGLGMVLLEAMRYQRPCIASRLGGITDIVADGETGLLVPPADPPALAAAIERLADDAALARTLGEAGRRINAARFAWDGVVEAYQRLYRGEAADGAL